MANVRKMNQSSLTTLSDRPGLQAASEGLQGEEARGSGEERKRGGPARPPARRPTTPGRPSSPGAPSVLGQVLTRGAERQCDGGHCLLGDLPKQHKINPALFPRKGSSNRPTTRGTMPSPTLCSPGRRALRLLQPQGRAFQLRSRLQ